MPEDQTVWWGYKRRHCGPRPPKVCCVSDRMITAFRYSGSAQNVKFKNSLDELPLHQILIILSPKVIANRKWGCTCLFFLFFLFFFCLFKADKQRKSAKHKWHWYSGKRTMGDFFTATFSRVKCTRRERNCSGPLLPLPPPPPKKKAWCVNKQWSYRLVLPWPKNLDSRESWRQ